MKRIASIVSAVLVFIGCGAQTKVDNSVSGEINLDKCLGTWYEIARSLSISQGAVNQRAMNAGWPLIKHTLTLLEHINYDRYVV